MTFFLPSFYSIHFFLINFHLVCHCHIINVYNHNLFFSFYKKFPFSIAYFMCVLPLFHLFNSIHLLFFTFCYFFAVRSLFVGTRISYFVYYLHFTGFVVMTTLIQKQFKRKTIVIVIIKWILQLKHKKIEKTKINNVLLWFF